MDFYNKAQENIYWVTVRDEFGEDLDSFGGVFASDVEKVANDYGITDIRYK